jgi:hypothetical protein
VSTWNHTKIDKVLHQHQHMLEESWDVNCSIAEVMIANMDNQIQKPA